MNLTHEYLSVDERNVIAAIWEKYKQFTIRPVRSTEKYYHQFIEEYAKGPLPALVFGGTPEIRSLLQQQQKQTILVDRSRVMVEAMGLLTEANVPLATTELFCECEWSSLTLADSSMQVALGDDAINMLDWGKFPVFLAEVKRVLAPGGLFACHLLVQPAEEYRRQSITDVTRLYQQGKIESFFDYASRVNFSFYDSSTYRMGWQASIAGLRAAIADGSIADDYSFIEYFKDCKSSFACPPIASWDSLVREYFQVCEIIYPTEFDYCRFEPLYILKKNG